MRLTFLKFIVLSVVVGGAAWVYLLSFRNAEEPNYQIITTQILGIVTATLFLWKWDYDNIGKEEKTKTTIEINHHKHLANATIVATIYNKKSERVHVQVHIEIEGSNKQIEAIQLKSDEERPSDTGGIHKVRHMSRVLEPKEKEYFYEIVDITKLVGKKVVLVVKTPDGKTLERITIDSKTIEDHAKDEKKRNPQALSKYGVVCRSSLPSRRGEQPRKPRQDRGFLLAVRQLNIGPRVHTA